MFESHVGTILGIALKYLGSSIFKIQELRLVSSKFRDAIDFVTLDPFNVVVSSSMINMPKDTEKIYYINAGVGKQPETHIRPIDFSMFIVADPQFIVDSLKTRIIRANYKQLMELKKTKLTVRDLT